ncbi:methionine gamma-lyase [Salicibibacter cibarius]|uniref:L-methionine gamma-lyase n=1 Tax=Salicibibacter cibarius TaxID=2743000 RepID=A0A7T6Z2F8_9BACI|nr:methionine gamma-lyase [Salicibibacter cibarius]QQK75729.1 methionine gamma-lyase [Salicibibacter cibarius]
MPLNKETGYIHGHEDKERHYGSLVPPIYQSSTFTFPDAESGAARFSGNGNGYMYSRLGNPTVREFEERMAAAERGEKALAFASGMAAVSAVLTSLLRSGDHVLVSKGVYGCTFGLLSWLSDRFDVHANYISMENKSDLAENLQPTTKVIYVETPINPTMKMTDFSLITQFAQEHNLTVIVDNTFASPYLQRPLEHNADVVVHSATKYLGGHGDVIAGVAVGSFDFMEVVRKNAQKDMGGVLGSFEAWLLLRGMKTLSVRMDRHCANAKVIAEKLKKHLQVETIFFPGDPDFQQCELTSKQMDQPGGMISFTVKGGKEAAFNVMNRLKMIAIAVSLGDAETLIQHPASMTHAVIPEAEREFMGISDNMLRLSVGLEHYEDIWNDLEQALAGN